MKMLKKGFLIELIYKNEKIFLPIQKYTINNKMDPNVEKIVEAAASGAITYGVIYAMLGNYGGVRVAGMEFSPAMGMASTVFVSDLAASYIGDELAKLNTMDELDDAIKGTIKPVLVGGCSVVAAKMLIGDYKDNSAIFKVAGLGAGSSVLGAALLEMVPK